MAESEDVMQPEDYLAHYGVLGMKWGVRKDDKLGPGGPQNEKPQGELVLKTPLKNGGELQVYRKPASSFAKWRAKRSPKVADFLERSNNFTLKNERGEKVGDASFYETSKTELNLEWIGVNAAHRGKGYATAVMRGMRAYAEDNGIEKMTLEVPGESPDALHIYEKIGFKQVGKTEGSEEDDFWGGLTNMEMNFPKKKTLAHADPNRTMLDYIVREINKMPKEPTEEELGDELMHYGVLGMKWGRRKDRGNSAVTPSSDSTKVRELRKKNLKELSNQELRDLTQRQQLEQQYAKLNPSKVDRGRNAVKAGIAFGATGVAVYNMVNSPAGKAAIKAGKTAYENLIKKL